MPVYFAEVHIKTSKVPRRKAACAEARSEKLTIPLRGPGRREQTQICSQLTHLRELPPNTLSVYINKYNIYICIYIHIYIYIYI